MNSNKLTPSVIKSLKGRGFLNNRGTENFSARVITVNGKITSAQQRCLADAADLFGNGSVSFTSRLTVEVPGIPYEKIEPFCAAIAKEGLETGGTGPKVRPIVSCKGTICQYGLIDTLGLSEKIHRRFYKGYRQVVLPHKFKIAVGGCPNNCVKPDINDLGVIGQRVPTFKADLCRGCKSCAVERSCPVQACHIENNKLKRDPERCNLCGRCIGKCPFGSIPDGERGYKVTLGGRWGKIVGRGRPLRKLLKSEEEVCSVIEKTILFYRENGFSGERFAQTIERIGFDRVQDEILGDAIMARKEDILAAALKS